MTTIAANHECMAADSRVTGGGAMYPADKIFRVGISLFGTAGDGFMSLAFIEWLRTRRNMQVLHKMIPMENRADIRVIELRQGLIYLWDGWGVPEKVNLPYYAIGSGAKSALVELKRGASPHDAVAAAMEWDEYSGHGIQVELLKTRRKRG